MRFSVGLLLGLVPVIFAAGWYSHAGLNREELASVQVFPAMRPIWDSGVPCLPPNPAEQQQIDRVLAVLANTPDLDHRSLRYRPLLDGVVKFFGRPFAMSLQNMDEKKHTRWVCPSSVTLDQVAKETVRLGYFSTPVLHEDGIRLAERLGPRAPQITEALARTAFNALRVPASPWEEDQRIHARTVLAGFGEAAGPWAGRAFVLAGNDTPLGTTAAQLSVGGGDPRALPMAAKLMTGLLAATPKDHPLSYVDGLRLDELSVALQLGGSRAEPYAAPLIDFMNREVVQPMGPPTGVGTIPWPPVMACVSAAYISGKVLAAAQRHEHCKERLAALSASRQGIPISK